MDMASRLGVSGDGLYDPETNMLSGRDEDEDGKDESVLDGGRDRGVGACLGVAYAYALAEPFAVLGPDGRGTMDAARRGGRAGGGDIFCCSWTIGDGG